MFLQAEVFLKRMDKSSRLSKNTFQISYSVSSWWNRKGSQPSWTVFRPKNFKSMAVDKVLGEDEWATGVSLPSSWATAISKLLAQLVRICCISPPPFLSSPLALEGVLATMFLEARENPTGLQSSPGSLSVVQNSICGGPSNCDAFILVTCHSVWKYAIQIVIHSFW